MLDTDAPQAEPLRLTLEEALAMAVEKKWRVDFYADGFVLIVDDFGDDIAHEYGWLSAFSVALGRPVVERDGTSELVEALAEPLRYFLEWREEIESDLGVWASKSQTREAFDQAEAVLARVKGGAE